MVRSHTLSSDTSISEDAELLPDLIVHSLQVLELRGPSALFLRFICGCVLPRCDQPVHHGPFRNGRAVDARTCRNRDGRVFDNGTL